LRQLFPPPPPFPKITEDERVSSPLSWLALTKCRWTPPPSACSPLFGDSFLSSLRTGSLRKLPFPRFYSPSPFQEQAFEKRRPPFYGKNGPAFLLVGQSSLGMRGLFFFRFLFPPRPGNSRHDYHPPSYCEPRDPSPGEDFPVPLFKTKTPETQPSLKKRPVSPPRAFRVLPPTEAAGPEIDRRCRELILFYGKIPLSTLFPPQRKR